jgi:hypothetical protein
MSAFQRFSVSAFSIATLRAGQFAGRFLFGPQSTDCVFVLLAHTAQKSGKQNHFSFSKAEMTKAETRNQFPLFLLPLTQKPSSDP